MGIAIEVENLSKSFGSSLIWEDVTLTIPAGEVSVILGPSGTGKSVFLKSLIGLLRPERGKILIDGTDIIQCSAKELYEIRTMFGVMFQDGALFSTLTILENVEAPLREHTQLSAPLRAHIAALKLSMAGLDPSAHHKKPAQISGGMRKRAAVARAIALDPELLFLDEPTAGLDPISAGNFDEMTRDLARSLGLTVFLVTHDLDTLHAIADRVAVLYGGKVAAIGTIPEIEKDATGWVAEYFSGPRGRAATRGVAER